MRRRVLILLVVLLSLRGWVGEAMAGQMLAMAVAKAQADVVAMVQPAAMPDCHEPMQGPAAEQADAGQAACGACLHCEACFLGALPPDVRIAPGPAPRSAPPPWRAHFASAEPLPGFKPPIS